MDSSSFDRLPISTFFFRNASSRSTDSFSIAWEMIFLALGRKLIPTCVAPAEASYAATWASPIRATNRLSVRASVATGFKAPALHELFAGDILGFEQEWADWVATEYNPNKR